MRVGLETCGLTQRTPYTGLANRMTLLVMLEDDLERIERFTTILARTVEKVELSVSRTSHQFIAAYVELTRKPHLIALDHDLFTDSPNEPDPGDGRDVVAFLVTQTPVCPVLIHTTNAPAADSMLITLREHGWTADRIAPLGHDWIEAYWYPYAMRMLGRTTAH